MYDKEIDMFKVNLISSKLFLKLSNNQPGNYIYHEYF